LVSRAVMKVQRAEWEKEWQKKYLAQMVADADATSSDE
jgi:hypothetical protein